MKKKVPWGILCFLMLVAALLVFAGNFVFETAVLRAHGSTAEASVTLPDAWMADHRAKTWTLVSADELTLHAVFVPANQPTDRTVLLIHGYGASGSDMDVFVRMYVEELGFNVLLPDCRAHGQSQGDMIGFGWLDRLDMLRWVDRIQAERGPRERILLHGLSMGGTTAMMMTGERLPSNVLAVVEDCGYSTLVGELAHQMWQLYKLPSFPILNIAGLISTVRAGYAFEDASAVAQLEKNHLPVLFIHGEADRYVPFAMLEEVYQATRGDKYRYTVPGAEHAEAYRTDPQAYTRAVREFVEKYIAP